MQNRTEVLSDIPGQVDFIDSLPEYELSLYDNKKMKTNPETALDALTRSLPALEALEEWNENTVHDALFSLIKSLDVKNGYILWPVRVAVSGRQFTPGGALELCCILGKKDSLDRIRRSIDLISSQIR